MEEFVNVSIPQHVEKNNTKKFLTYISQFSGAIARSEIQPVHFLEHINFSKVMLPLKLPYKEKNVIVIDICELCSQFNCNAVRLDSILFDSSNVNLEYFELFDHNKSKTKIFGQLYEHLKFLKNFPEKTVNQNKTTFKFPFFNDIDCLLLKSETKIMTKLKSSLEDVDFTVYVELFNFADPLSSVSNYLNITNYSKNYVNFNIGQENVAKQNHTVELHFQGKVNYLLLHVQPFNKKCKFEITGTLYKGNDIIAILQPQINKINFGKLVQNKKCTYDSNLVIVPFFVKDSEREYLKLNKNIPDDKLTLNFSLYETTVLEKSGSAFIEIYGPCSDTLTFDFNMLGYEKVNMYDYRH